MLKLIPQYSCFSCVIVDGWKQDWALISNLKILAMQMNDQPIFLSEQYSRSSCFKRLLDEGWFPNAEQATA